MYCDIKHIVNVTDVDGSKLEDSVTKHEKIFLGEVGRRGVGTVIVMLAKQLHTKSHLFQPQWPGSMALNCHNCIPALDSIRLSTVCECQFAICAQ